jgi:hypothetical protein
MTHAARWARYVAARDNIASDPAAFHAAACDVLCGMNLTLPPRNCECAHDGCH